MKPKVWIKLGANFLVFAVLLFGPAGKLALPAAWAFLILFFGGGLVLITRALAAIPAGLQWLGAAGILISMWICSRIVQVNPFLANVVKIQTERGHEVVTEGPYSFVRHPLYAATLLLLPSAAFMLGSWFGVAAAIPLAGVLVLRTALEDRELHQRLDGYADYAQRVRYRLVPWVW